MNNVLMIHQGFDAIAEILAHITTNIFLESKNGRLSKRPF